MHFPEPQKAFTRRNFLTAGTVLTGALFLNPFKSGAAGLLFDTKKKALALSHFPHPVYAFIWRNWTLVPLARIAAVLKTTEEHVRAEGLKLGLSAPPTVSEEQWNRSYLTIIRRNWHLLPEQQLLELLGWTQEKLEFTLQEDDFFYIKLGSLKPECDPLSFQDLVRTDTGKLQWFQKVLKEEFPAGLPEQKEPYFQFVKDLSVPPVTESPVAGSGFQPRFGYAYFALFGDPLLDESIDPYPEGYLERMAASGMDGTWMHIVLSQITPFPWEPSLSENWEKRLENLQKLVSKAKEKGIGIYLYLNEPRNQTPAFFRKYPQLKGAGNSLCTSIPEVQQYLSDSIATITERVPGLAGFFSITASENPTNCWSHGKGNECPRCSVPGPGKVIAALNTIYENAISRGFDNYKKKNQQAINSKPPRLIAWDWGWKDNWAEAIIPDLPKNMAIMSVSEWNLNIERGGIQSKVGEYSISGIGPGPRATRHWQIARQHGLQAIAKIQAGNTWEIAAVPYIPALENVANHVANLRKAGVDGLMLGWTLGGYPSPNLEVVALLGSNPDMTPVEAMQKVAVNRYGIAGNEVVKAWRQFSKAFSQFPYHIGVVYNAPLQSGPSNLLWQKPTGYSSTMVGIAYDDLKSWRSIYPEAVFIQQLRTVATGFQEAVNALRKNTAPLTLSESVSKALEKEINVAETVAVHYESIANQSEIILLRDQENQGHNKQTLARLLRREIALAKQMAALQCSDSRLGFEASNHYFYIPADLVEKVMNCRMLLEKWA